MTNTEHPDDNGILMTETTQSKNVTVCTQFQGRVDISIAESKDMTFAVHNCGTHLPCDCLNSNKYTTCAITVNTMCTLATISRTCTPHILQHDHGWRQTAAINRTSRLPSSASPSLHVYDASLSLSDGILLLSHITSHVAQS